MPAVEPRDFHLTEAQQRFLDDHGLSITLRGGRRCGRRYAAEIHIAAIAASPEEARLAIEDLRSQGIATLTVPCLDCDEAGCEKCGGTGRRRV